jgi:hypothetical protein
MKGRVGKTKPDLLDQFPILYLNPVTNVKAIERIYPRPFAAFGVRKLLQAENLHSGSFVPFTIHDPQSTESPCKLISQNRLKA